MRLRKYVLHVSDSVRARQMADRLRQMGFTAHEDTHARDGITDDSLYGTGSEGNTDRRDLVFIRQSWGSPLVHFILFVAMGIGAIYPIMLRFWPLMAYAAIPVPNVLYALYSRYLPSMIVIRIRAADHYGNDGGA